MTLPVDLTSQDHFRDPAATVRTLQAAGRVVEVKFPIGRVWMTTTQEMASRVLKDGKLFTMRKDDGAIAARRWWIPRILRFPNNHMLNADEPDHTRQRGVVDEAFRRRAVLEMEPRVRAIADELVGKLFAQDSPADLVTRYSRRQGYHPPACDSDAERRVTAHFDLRQRAPLRGRHGARQTWIRQTRGREATKADE